MSETGSRRRGSSSAPRSNPADSGGPDLVQELKHLKGRAGEVAGAVREGAGNAARQVSDKAVEMTRAITGTIKEEAERLFDEQKGKAASKVTRYGKVIHQAGHALRAVKAEGLAEVVDSAAEKVEGITGYLEERNLAQVLEDVGEVARRNPGLMMGGMFLTGLALSRFLKASASREEEREASGGESDEGTEAESEDESGGGEERSSRGGSRRR